MSTEQQHLESRPALAGGAGDDLELDREEWAAVCPREITPEQWSRFEGYMEEIFAAMGMPAGTVSTADTPRRFLRAIFDATGGYEGDEKLVTAFPTECHGGPDCRISQVVEGPIPFFSLCEHHSLPFFGKAYVGYIAHEHILGLSKLTRLVRLFARRFTAGADRPAARRRAGADPSAAWGRGAPGGGAPVHADARRPRDRIQHPHYLLARQLRRRPAASRRVLRALQSARLTSMAGSGTSQAAGGLPPPLAVLYERAGLPAWPLPRVLAEVYGGDLGFRQPCVHANFVASVDGVTALGQEYPSSGSAISLHDPADRFVMGLLRACADVVLIGAGTLRATPGHRWTPAYVCPAAADGYAALRRTRGLPIDPLLAVVTARGDIPAGHPALRADALILTTAAGARRLHGRLLPRGTILDLGDQPELSPADVLAAARARGGSMMLTEGGPRLLGQLAAGGLLDELFLTVSPVLAGRGDTARPGLVAGLELLPGRTEPAELLTVRRHGSYLFLRYAMRGTAPAAEPGGS